MAHVHLVWENQTAGGDRESRSVKLPVQIGRSDDNDIILKDKRAGVSRRHARLSREDDRITLSDLKSTNGTRLNGTRIDRSPVEHGDSFEIGTYRFLLELHVICTNSQCRRSISIEHHMCPYCGRFLADAQTTLF